MDVASLPAVITPALFFEKMLIEWAEEIFTPPPLIEEVKFAIQIDLVGDEGGMWSLHFDLGDVECQTSPAMRPLLAFNGHSDAWMTTSGQWLKEFAQKIEDAGGPEDFIEQLIEKERQQGHPEIRLTDDILQALLQHPTLFAFTLKDYEGQDMHLLMGLWCTDFSKSPDITVTLDGETLRALRDQTLHPLSAWKQKKILVEGNLNLGLKLAKILRP